MPFFFAQNDGSISFCGDQDHMYPDPRGMGYPFDKIWSSRVTNASATVSDIVASKPHIKLSEFKIYRETEVYEGEESPCNHTIANITWEGTIKHFFTSQDINCMREYHIDLNNKECVRENAKIIYKKVASHAMPLYEKKWSDERVSEFKEWMDGCFP